MTEAKKRNRTAQPGKEAGQQAGRRRKPPDRKTSPDEPLSEYTPQQRERIRKGLRILARVIVRAHLRRQAELDGPD